LIIFDSGAAKLECKKYFLTRKHKRTKTRKK
jgi:hypothetical protein